MKRMLWMAAALMMTIGALADETMVTSPDGKLKVNVTDEQGKVSYAVTYDGKNMLMPSALGLNTNIGDYTSGLTLKNKREKHLTNDYVMHNTKQSNIHYDANELQLDYANADGGLMTIEFRVSNRDVAYRYTLPEPAKGAKHQDKCVVIKAEASSFMFPEQTTTFICPQIGPMTGWMRTKPSYEEEYKADEPMNVKSQFGHGYTFPCLFHIGNDGWALVSETGVTSNYCGSHLSDYQAGKGYTIAFPDAGENNGVGSNEAAFPLPGSTPWRTITLGTTLKPIVETTVPFDVVEPLYEPSENLKPGRYTWSWLIWQDNSVNYDDQVKFIDLAATMGYEYCLVDALWDTQIGRDKMEQLSKYAQSKGVNLLLWYNSNGFENDAPQTPKNCLNTAIARDREMKWLQKIGVKGIKVDFFGGDKQETIKLYEDILADANRYGLQVIFHGCTIPRGWERMYPNYAASEAVLASENVFFTEYHAKKEAQELTMHPFCRNAVGAMDWGGTIMNKYISKDNKSRHPRYTTDMFEIAAAYINQSNIQCVAIQPNNLSELPQTEIDLLKDVTTTWDETQFIDGYPMKYVVLARRHGDNWYVAGLNGTKEVKKLTLHLPMFAGKTVKCYADAEQKEVRTLKVNKKGMAVVTLLPQGGLLIK